MTNHCPELKTDPAIVTAIITPIIAIPFILLGLLIWWFHRQSKLERRALATGVVPAAMMIGGGEKFKSLGGAGKGGEIEEHPQLGI